MGSDADPRRQIPRTDALLADDMLTAAAVTLGTAAVKAAVAAAQDRARRGELPPNAVLAAAQASVSQLLAASTSLRRVVNATGVVVHTNLGRAPLTDAAREALLAASGYVDVEFDIEQGRRARRGRGTLAALAAAVPPAEAVLVVNNAAAALVLMATALSRPGGISEIVVSRGELIEIGDGFRLPELLESTGTRLREVGTTNRTAAADYRAVLGERTAAVLKVHPSNYLVSGFTRSVSVRELAEVVREKQIPLVYDVGSGLLRPDPLLTDEPDVATALADGADLVIASGDKLLGGPQAGIIVGRKDIVERLRRHPLARALRVDKLTLAALEATLSRPETRVSAALHADPEFLRARTEALAAGVPAAGGEVVPHDGAVGGGGAPGLGLPGWALALPEAYAAPLRHGHPCIVTRVRAGRCLLDLRCVQPAEDAEISLRLSEIAATEIATTGAEH